MDSNPMGAAGVSTNNNNNHNIDNDPFGDNTPTRGAKTYQYSSSGTKLFSSYSRDNVLSSQRASTQPIGEQQAARGPLPDELKQKMMDLEREYRGIDTARGSTTSRTNTSMSTNVASPAPSGLLSSPTKPAPPSSRRSRNQPSGRVHDIEFATEISTSLLGQVRSLQNILAEKDEALKAAVRDNAKLQAENENFTYKLRGVDDNHNRFKEANWNLETRLQDMQALVAEAEVREMRLTSNLNAVKAERSNLEREHDEVRKAHSRLGDDHASLQRQYDLESLGMRRNLAAIEDEREELQQKIEELTSHNEELQRAMAYRAENQHDTGRAKESSARDMEATDLSTPRNSPPGSPVKATPRHAALETETVKSSLNHAHRMIQTLKANVHREKTEKSELKRMLQDARDELESRRTDGPGNFAANAGKKRRPNAAQDANRRSVQPGKLGALGRTQQEIMDDLSWEDDETHLGRPRDAGRDNYDLTEGSEAFETAHERDSATDTDAFQTGVESMRDEDEELTETEENQPRRMMLGTRPRMVSKQSTASDDDFNLATPVRSDQPRYKLRMSRGENNRSFDAPESRDSPASYTSGSSLPGGGLNLAAELDDVDQDESSFADSTTSRATASHFTRVNGVASRQTTPFSPGANQSNHMLPEPTMVDSGMLTEPWSPKRVTISDADQTSTGPAFPGHPSLFPSSHPDTPSRSIQQYDNNSQTQTTNGPYFSSSPGHSPAQYFARSSPTLFRADHSQQATTMPKTAALQMSVISSLATAPVMPAVQHSFNVPQSLPTREQNLPLARGRAQADEQQDSFATLGRFYSDGDQPRGMTPSASYQQLPRMDFGSSLPMMLGDQHAAVPSDSSMAFVDHLLHHDTTEIASTEITPSMNDASTQAENATRLDASERRMQGSGDARGIYLDEPSFARSLGSPSRNDARTYQENDTRSLFELPAHTGSPQPFSQVREVPFPDNSFASAQRLHSLPESPQDVRVGDMARALGNAPPLGTMTTDEGTQTVVSADLIDSIMRERKGKARLSSTSPYNVGSPKTRTSSVNSRADLEVDTRHFKRPGSATSIRDRAISPTLPPLPPLPSDHREVIAAATNRNPNVPGVMGPPAVPAQLRPRTPTGPAGTAHSMHSARYKARSTAGRSDVTSPMTRRSSVSSFASEVDERFNVADARPLNVRASGTFRLEEDVDPRMIQAITQTMIGEFLWKYTRRTGRSGHSNNRHRRFFWIHPYTRTLYWSVQDPAGNSGSARVESQAKSVGIEAIRVVSDDNGIPPGLHGKSIVVVTSGRSIKFTAPTAQRHETWFNALSYLLLRNTADDQSIHRISYSGKAHSMAGSARERPATATSINSDDLNEFNAGVPRPISRTTMMSGKSGPATLTRPVTVGRPEPTMSMRSTSPPGPNSAADQNLAAVPSLLRLQRTASPQSSPAYIQASNQIPSLAVRQSQAAMKRSAVISGPVTEYPSGAANQYRAASPTPSSPETFMRPITPNARPLSPLTLQQRPPGPPAAPINTVPGNAGANNAAATQSMLPPSARLATAKDVTPAPVTPQSARARPMSMQVPSSAARSAAVVEAAKHQSPRPMSASSGRFSSLANRFRSGFSSRSRTDNGPPPAYAQRGQSAASTNLRHATIFAPDSSVGSSGTVINRSGGGGGGAGGMQVENVRACCDG